MAKNKKNMPTLQSINKMVEFFETHDLGDYWDQMPEARFDIDIKRKTHIVAIDADLVERLATVSKSKNISSGKLVNVWLREKPARQRLINSVRQRKTTLTHAH